VDVQNRLARATPRLPSAVTQQGVRVEKSRSQLPAVHHPVVGRPGHGIRWRWATTPSRNMLPELQRLPGVGQAQLFGTERAMRVWVDPAKLQGFNLSQPRW
jgi:multidrug efflux pump